MKKLAGISLLVLMCACGSTEGPIGDDDDDDFGPDAIGPVEVGEVDDVDPVDGFALEPLTAPATSAVSAVTPDGAIYYGYIDGVTGWPVVVDDVGERHSLDGGTHPDGNDGLAMVASADGAVHVVSFGGGIIYYARLRDGEFDPTQSIAPVPGRDATIAIAPSGEVVIAYVADSVPAKGLGEPSRIHIVRGVPSEAGVEFGSPTVANPSCCINEFGDVAEQMSGPSLAIGVDGTVHVVFEWTTFANSTIEYVHNRGGQFNPPVTISEAAFVPCPALAIDENNKAYISFIEEPNRDVFLSTVEDDVVSERVSLYTTDEYITMSMMVRDGAGDIHVLVTDNTAPGGRLLYVAPGADPLDAPIEVTTTESPGFVEMTPRAGGLLVSPDGNLLIGFERVPRWDQMGQAEVAISR